MLLYRSAYPIRYELDHNNISIAKESTGLNVRIYELNRAEIQANILSNKINKMLFDVWREVRFYEYSFH